jgi:hypothetical protein
MISSEPSGMVYFKNALAGFVVLLIARAGG